MHVHCKILHIHSSQTNKSAITKKNRSPLYERLRKGATGFAYLEYSPQHCCRGREELVFDVAALGGGCVGMQLEVIVHGEGTAAIRELSITSRVQL